MALLPHPPQLPAAPGDKVQHMLAFCTLGAIAAAGWRKRSLLTLFVALCLFGGAIELLQMIPALHRDAEATDWLADMVAAAVSLAAVRAVLSRL